MNTNKVYFRCPPVPPHVYEDTWSWKLTHWWGKDFLRLHHSNKRTDFRFTDVMFRNWKSQKQIMKWFNSGIQIPWVQEYQFEASKNELSKFRNKNFRIQKTEVQASTSKRTKFSYGNFGVQEYSKICYVFTGYRLLGPKFLPMFYI